MIRGSKLAWVLNYANAGLLAYSAWTHSAIGVCVFLFMIMFINTVEWGEFWNDFPGRLQGHWDESAKVNPEYAGREAPSTGGGGKK